MKKIIFSLTSALALLLGAPVLAQNVQFRSFDPLQAMPKMSFAEKAAKEKQFRVDYPLLAQEKEIVVPQPGLTEVQPVIPYRSVASAVGNTVATTASTFWPYIAYYEGWPTVGSSKRNLSGVYEFTPTGSGPYALDSIKVNTSMRSSGGAAVVDGVYYKYFIDKTYISYGIIVARLYSYDINTWEPTATSGEDMTSHLDMYALATCQASDGTVYGEFYTQDLNSREYGIVDYKNKSRSVIASATKSMVAMGIANDGTWYGVASDGNLYTINKETGAETLVGATGMTLEDSDGSFYKQTGTIDPKTNIFYWCALDANAENGGVYTVNLTTGAATKVGDFVGGQAQVYDLIVAGKLAEGGAPARATNLTATFLNGSTSGNISFKAPTRDYADSTDLTGELNYAVTLNNDTLASGVCSPGENVNAAVTAAEGLDKFVVITSNASGVSPMATVTTYVGFDIPNTPASVTATWNDDKSKAVITWNAVTEGKHKAYLGPISYKVVRQIGSNSTVVAESISDTTITDNSAPASGEMTSAKYMVQAVNGTKVSAWASSNGIAVGSAFNVPYHEDFNDADDVGMFFTIIDANADGKTWTWNYGFGNPHMRLNYNSAKASDDWLITPPINFKGGREYNLAFKSHGRDIYPEKIEVKYGTANTVEGMTNEILPVTVMTKDTTVFSGLTFTPSEDGIYYIGFHGCSDKDMFWTKVDSIDIQATVLSTTPDAPVITVTPGNKGALTAVITVTAPTKNQNGDDLTADHLSRMVLRRGDETIHTFENPAPGATVTYADTVPADGSYLYTVTPYDGDDYGKKAEVNAYIGMDIPKAVQNAVAYDNSTSVHFAWDPATEQGVNGGYVDTTTLKTIIYNVDNGYLGDAIDTVTNATSYDLAYDTNEGDPVLAVWGLKNLNRAGSSSAVAVPLPVGRPYTLPFIESAPGGQLQNKWWIDRSGGTRNNNLWAYITEDAADNDGGSFAYQATIDSVSGFMNSYKINLGNAAYPKLVFSYNVKYSYPSTKGKIQVEVQTSDGATTPVFESPVFTGDQAWSQNVVDLSQFAGQIIKVKFHTFCFNAPVTIGLDKIRIQDGYTDDLSASLTAPQSVIKGQTINAVVKVTNEGTSAQNAYTVKVFADDVLLSTTDVTEELDAFSDKSFAVSIPTSALPTDKTEKVIKAQVVMEGDLKEANNTAVATVITANSDYPAPENLTATDAQPHVLLSWDAPSANAIPYTEDFESYVPFALSSTGAISPELGGGWTTIDGQAGQTPTAKLGSLWKNYTYPGQGLEGSFLIFNADSVVTGGFNSNAFMHGHNDSYQFAAMPYEAAGSGFADGDNYLVSPAQVGLAQTVTFYAKNALTSSHDYPEKFEFLYSTTGNTKEAFTNVVIPDTTLTGGEWQYFEAALPAEATYFAIHQTSSAAGTGNYLFGVDDVTFMKGVAKPTGYNVYCDGELVGHIGTDGTLEFYGTAPDGSHVWSVTAIYPDGQESDPVSISAATDISSIAVAGEPFDVYTLDGALIRSQVRDVKDLKTGVYIVNGRKVIVK